MLDRAYDQLVAIDCLLPSPLEWALTAFGSWFTIDTLFWFAGY